MPSRSAASKRPRGDTREEKSMVTVMANSFAKADVQRAKTDLDFVHGELEKEENIKRLHEMANMMRNHTLQKAIEAYTRANDPIYKSLGKELAAGTRKFKMLRDNILKKALIQLEPTIFSDEVFAAKKETLTRDVVLNLVCFSLNEDEEACLPTNWASLRFESGLVAYMHGRYELMGKRLSGYTVGGGFFGYFAISNDGWNVETKLAHLDGGDTSLCMAIPAIGDPYDWQLLNPHEQSATLSSEGHAVEISLAARFKRTLGKDMWPREDDAWEILEGRLPAVVKSQVSTLSTSAAAGSSGSASASPSGAKRPRTATGVGKGRKPPAGNGKVAAKAPKS